MGKIKCITFDKKAQDNLPQHIKDKMKADRAKAGEEIILPYVNSMCESHKPKILPYILQDRWAEKQAEKGLKQTQCEKCNRWFFPSEL